MRQFVASVICFALLAVGCGGGSRMVNVPTAPGQVASPAPPLFPSITVGEAVRFRFTADDVPCVSGDGRCCSYNVTASSDGRLEVELTSVAGEGSFVSTTEMYVVPGGDSWDVGPGPRISVTVPVRAATTYEIRMFSDKVPSVELELRASLK